MSKPIFKTYKIFDSRKIPDDILLYLQELFIDNPWVVQAPQYSSYKVARSNKDKFSVPVSAFFIKNGAEYGETILIHFE